MQDLNHRLEKCVEFAKTELSTGQHKDGFLDLLDTGVVFLSYSSRFLDEITDEKIKESYSNPNPESLYDLLNRIEQIQDVLNYHSSKNFQNEEIRQGLLKFDIGNYRIKSSEVIAQYYLKQVEKSLDRAVDKEKIFETYEFDEDVLHKTMLRLAELHPQKLEKNEIGEEVFTPGVFIDKDGFLYIQEGDDFESIGISQYTLAQIVHTTPKETFDIDVYSSVLGKPVSEERGDILYIELKKGEWTELINYTERWKVSPQSNLQMIVDADRKMHIFKHEKATEYFGWIVTENGRAMPELRTKKVELDSEFTQPDSEGVIEIYTKPTFGLEQKTLVGMYDTKTGKILTEDGFFVDVMTDTEDGKPFFMIYKNFQHGRLYDFQEGKLPFVEKVISGKIGEDERKAIEAATLGYFPDEIASATDFLRKAQSLVKKYNLDASAYEERMTAISGKIENSL